METQITLDREQTLADYETLGRLRAMLDMLEQAEVLSRKWDWREEFLVARLSAVLESYRQMLMNEANEGIDPDIPTEAEVDEMARAEEIIRKTGRAPHEL